MRRKENFSSIVVLLKNVAFADYEIENGLVLVFQQ